MSFQSKSPPGLTGAIERMLDAIDANLRSGGYEGAPIDMFLAGGVAVNHYCGVRFTADVDASFSRRVLVPADELVFDYQDEQGVRQVIHFDAQYNPTFALMHEDFQEDAVEWEGIGNERRLVRLRVLSPVDLAVSKLARFASHDQEDILALAREGLITSEGLRERAEQAIGYYVGNTSMVQQSLNLMCERIEKLGRADRSAPSPR